MVVRQIRVIGRVQGVGFRDALRAEAVRLGVAGWVRNRTDGIVEARLEGNYDSVERLIDWARRGPRMARVDRLEEMPAIPGPQAEARDFLILPTA
jgi:acylphosphatase